MTSSLAKFTSAQVMFENEIVYDASNGNGDVDGDDSLDMGPDDDRVDD